jgi:hypothetical protein
VDSDVDKCVFSHDVVIDEHGSLFSGNSDHKPGLKFLVDSCDTAENPVFLNRSVRHEVGQTSRSNVAAEIPKDQHDINAEISPN